MGLLVCAEIFVDGEPYTWNAATQHYDHVNGNEFVLFVTDDPAPPIPIDDPNVVVYYQLISGLDVVDQGRVV